MVSEADICNLALGKLGVRGLVTSLAPVDLNSFEAEKCAQFYPIARDTILAAHSFSFNTRRNHFARLTQPPPSAWAYQYVVPAECLHVLQLQPRDALSDQFASYPEHIREFPFSSPAAVETGYTAQPFTVETNENGERVILTNALDPVVRYRARITNTQTYSALAVSAIAWWLAGDLAGPLIKGNEGAQMARQCWEAATALLAQAATQDAAQNHAAHATLPAYLQARF